MMDSLLWQIFENSDSFLYHATWCICTTNAIRIIKTMIVDIDLPVCVSEGE